jgi:hypothetical protein
MGKKKQDVLDVPVQRVWDKGDNEGHDDDGIHIAPTANNKVPACHCEVKLCGAGGPYVGLQHCKECHCDR